VYGADILLETYIALVAVIFTAMGALVAAGFFRSKTAEIPNLSHREQEVLHLISQGFSNAEIADKLFLSISTVKREVSGLFIKMDVKNRAEAQRKYSYFSRKS